MSQTGSLERLALIVALILGTACASAATEGEERPKKEVSDEEPGTVTSLQSAEILDARLVPWSEVAEACAPTEPVEEPVADGRLLTVRHGDVIARTYVSEGRVIHCGEESNMRNEQPSWRDDAGLRAAVDGAREDLAQRLSMEADSIQVVRAERVRWRDSSAGCPQPDRVYMQVLTDGSRVILSAGDREYRYHQVGNAAPFWCESPSPIEPLPGLEIQ